MIFNRILLMSSLLVFLLCCPSFAADIDCREQTECEEYDPCRCELATPIEIREPATVSEGSKFTASGGRPNYRYAMSPGQINPDTGVVTAMPDKCVQSVTVTVIDACTPPNEPATKTVQLDRPPLTLSGPDTPSNGDSYIASGGAPPYTYSMTGGSIDENGKVWDLTGCNGTVTVVDDCGAQAFKSFDLNQEPFDAGYVGNGCFGATGGVPPYGAEFSCGSMNGMCITSTSGCCGREIMRIFDSCGNEVKLYNSFGNWSTTYSGCADPDDESTNPGCFPSSPYSGCDWTYTSSTSRYLVSDWVPLGSNCDKYKVVQEINCP